ncbi:MAG: FHA domain-containing protein, partial [Candidatus Xenobia bacterium]
GFDFVAGTVDLPDAPAVPASPPSAPAAAPVNGAPAAYKAVITVDFSPRERTEGAQPPTDRTTRQFILDRDRLLIGRGSSSVHPDVVIQEDTGISRGHAELIRDRDGTYAIRDLDSANGTLVNGKPLQGAELVTLKPGDEIVIGFWHTITIQQI